MYVTHINVFNLHNNPELGVTVRSRGTGGIQLLSGGAGIRNWVSDTRACGYQAILPPFSFSSSFEVGMFSASSQKWK